MSKEGEIIIDGEPVVLKWDQSLARQYRFRASKAGITDEVFRLHDPATVEAAVFDILWCLIPEKLATRFPTPESLFKTIDHETQGEVIWKTVKSILEEQIPSAEKKRSSENSPSPESSSG